MMIGRGIQAGNGQEKTSSGRGTQKTSSGGGSKGERSEGIKPLVPVTPGASFTPELGM